jgi:hypothetical protein
MVKHKKYVVPFKETLEKQQKACLKTHSEPHHSVAPLSL